MQVVECNKRARTNFYGPNSLILYNSAKEGRLKNKK